MNLDSLIERGAAGGLVKLVREAHGLTQGELARRAGTTQSAISRLEHGDVSPTVETLQRLLLVMGGKLRLMSERIEHGYDRADLALARAKTPTERFREALLWNRTAARFADQGAERRSGGAA